MCHQGEMTQLKLHSGESFDLSLWRATSVSKFDLQCSYWCQEAGLGVGGRGRGHSEAQEEMLQSLVRK